MKSQSIKYLPVSIVIPTLGNESLKKTIEYLNRGNLIPSEILVCLPESINNRSKFSDKNNVKIILTKDKGQVLQRIEGFKQAKNDFVLQLDDDIELDIDSVDTLISVLKQNPKAVAAAPVYYNYKTGKCLHASAVGINGFLSNLFGLIICGAPWGVKRIGKVTAAGTNYGVDERLMVGDLIEVDWAPGGCLLLRHSSLIKDNFFPFTGKAYCEDLIHSYLLKKNGGKILIVKDAKCMTEAPIPPKNSNELLRDFHARRYFNKLRNVNLNRLYFWYGINWARRMIYDAPISFLKNRV